jgi:hypothetical protein
MKLDVVHTFFTNSNGGSSVPVFARLHHSSFEPTLLLMVSFPVGLRQMPIVFFFFFFLKRSDADSNESDGVHSRWS